TGAADTPGCRSAYSSLCCVFPAERSDSGFERQCPWFLLGAAFACGGRPVFMVWNKNGKAGGQFPARLAVNIWNDRDGRFDHLPPVMAMPWINCFWKIRYSTTMGIMASRLPAISTGKLVLYCPFSVERPADSVIMFRSVLQISGHIRSE